MRIITFRGRYLNKVKVDHKFVDQERSRPQQTQQKPLALDANTRPTSVEFFPVENDLTMIQHQASQDLIRQAMKITDLLMSVLQGEAVYSEEIKVMIKDLCDARPLMDNQMAEQAQAISLIHEILGAMPLPEHEKDTLVNMCVDLKGDLKTSLEQKKEKVA